MDISPKKILPIIKRALKEDIGKGDITSKLVLAENRNIKAEITAKEAGVACGVEVTGLVFAAVDAGIKFFPQVKDGQKIAQGQTLASLSGPAAGILLGERTALNFLGRLCGIATKTAEYVEQVRPYPVKIMDTRKTTPGLRILEKYAVRCGGGANHRMGLWDQILVKDNHWAILNSSARENADIEAVIKTIKNNKPKKMLLEVEVKNLTEFRQALTAFPDIIMLDNMPLPEIKEAVKLRNEKSKRHCPQLEISGGINIHNARGIAACGVERISIGELTHSVRALDVSLNYCE